MARENFNDLLAFVIVAREGKLHPRGRSARSLPIGIEPHDKRA